VELLRIRNGRSGAWNLKWVNGRFIPIPVIQVNNDPVEKRKVG